MNAILPGPPQPGKQNASTLLFDKPDLCDERPAAPPRNDRRSESSIYIYLAESGINIKYHPALQRRSNLFILLIALLAYSPWFLFELVTLTCDRKPYPEQYSVVQVMV